MSDVAGTTRDAIDTLVEHEGQMYRIVDTAGLRRKSQIDQDVEYYGFVRAMRAIDRADVALLVIDGTLGLTNEDQRVAGYAAERGCAMVIVLNKWDIVEGPEAKEKIRERIEDRMTFVGYGAGWWPPRRLPASVSTVSGAPSTTSTPTTAAPSPRPV